ncbi:MAG TPA: glycosyltransferase family 4 protein [Anaerolineales bacterium]|nr:glycosyltransferase family 4 protein [Anaerolineales bacterium]
MNILFLTQILPYPPDSGPRVKTWHVLKYLAQRGHTITLITYIRPEEEPHLETVRRICHRVFTVPIKRSRLKDAGYFIRSQLTRQPFLVERDDSAAMRTMVREVVTAAPVDAIHADQLTMAQFALPYRNGNRKPALIFDAHNAVWTIVERLNATLPFYYRLPLIFEAGRVKAYEARIVHEFDRTLAVAEPDARALREALKEEYPAVPAEEAPITVIPIAVDTKVANRFQPRIGSFNILTMGTLYYPPNADGIRWFLVEVFPIIRRALPQAKLTIVGKSPPADFLQVAKESDGSVAVTGYVPELDPYFAEASVVVIPVRAGGGMRVRILEAFAHGMPVVTTTVGLEGIQAEPGSDVLVADSPHEFAQSTIRLLSDGKLQARLSGNGIRLAKDKYDWQVVLSQLEKVYQSLA